MKKIVLALTLISSQIWAQSLDRELDAVVRNKRFKAKIEKVKLTNLISADSFDGEYFKIVKGKGSEAIKFTDEELRLKAATTYYHLTKARNYFVNTLKSEYVKNLPKINIRLELINKFNQLGHFANDNFDPQYNNALTIPAGDGYAPRNIPGWDIEIWFRPVKKIHLSEVDPNKQYNSFKQIFKSYRQQMHMQTLQRFLVEALRDRPAGAPGPLDPNNLFRSFGSSIFMELAYVGAPFIEWTFQRKWYKLDSALVPEIIYHEFAHVALSDSLVLSHSTPVIEGMADYFAGVIANSKKLATGIKKYNTFSGKKAKNKSRYRLQFETNEFANADFVFGLLFSVRDIVGQDVADKMIYNMREKIQTDSTIRQQLLDAVFDQCKEECPNYNVDRYKLYQLFYSKGI